MKRGKSTNQTLVIFEFLDVVLMSTYQKMLDSKEILKQRRASSFDMELESKAIDSMIQKCQVFSMAEMLTLMNQH